MSFSAFRENKKTSRLAPHHSPKSRKWIIKCYKAPGTRTAPHLQAILGHLNKPATIQHYKTVINRIQEYLEANVQEDVSLRRLADHSFVSYHHLTDIFEQVENESPGGYIRRYRLEKAASLLLYTNHSLAIVAEKTGYTGSPSLSKAFAQHFHCSPGVFRRKPHFLPHSPNVILDGIDSAAAYEAILTKEFSFQYRIQTIKDQYTVCKPLKMVSAFAQKHFLYDAYLQTVQDDLDTDIEGRFIIRPFDSLNFAPASKFTMHHGKLITAQAYAQLSQAMYTQYVVTPVKEGQYLVFDIPPGPVNEHITNYTTLFRENLIGYKKIFHLEDFYIFLLLSEEPDKIGEFYMYYAPSPDNKSTTFSTY